MKFFCSLLFILISLHSFGFSKSDSAKTHRVFFFFNLNINPSFSKTNKTYPKSSFDLDNLVIGNYFTGVPNVNTKHPLIGYRTAKGFEFGINLANKNFISFNYFKKASQETYDAVYPDPVYNQSFYENNWGINYTKNLTSDWFIKEGLMIYVGGQALYKTLNYSGISTYALDTYSSGEYNIELNSKQLKLNLILGLKGFFNKYIYADIGINFNALNYSKNAFTTSLSQINYLPTTSNILAQSDNSKWRFICPYFQYKNGQVVSTFFIKLGIELFHKKNYTVFKDTFFTY